MSKIIELPVPVLKYPHWRVNFRPSDYNGNRISSLGDCYKIIEKTKLSLRGWDYPHLSQESSERGHGNNWIASWSSFMGHIEYWRFYQSGQFLHLFSVREATEPVWKKKLLEDMQSHLSYRRDINWDNVPGFISTTNLIYKLTEVFEFAARLCETGIYKGPVEIKTEIHGIKSFVLTADWNRLWRDYYAASENVLRYHVQVSSDDLLANSTEITLNSIRWFFERFGWMNPSDEAIRRDVDNLLKGRT